MPIQIIKGTGSPKFQQLIDGAVFIGKLQTGNIWVITAEDVEDIHTHLEMDQSAPNMIKVEDSDSGTPTFVIDAKSKKH